MTLEMSQLRVLFRFWTWLFGLGGLIFFLFPDRVIASLNETSTFLPFLEPWPEIGASFWLPLAVSLMTTLTLLCVWIVRNLEDAQALVIAILVSKSTSSLVFFFFYIRQNFAAPFFWGALTDGLIFLITFYFYKRAMDSLKKP